jgi:hypothetical protein
MSRNIENKRPNPGCLPDLILYLRNLFLTEILPHKYYGQGYGENCYGGGEFQKEPKSLCHCRVAVVVDTREQELTTKLTCRYEAQRNSGQVK